MQRNDSPAQIKKQASIAFRNRLRRSLFKLPAEFREVEKPAPAKTGRPRPVVRTSLADETPLSPSEVAHGVYLGVFDSGVSYCD